MPPFICGLLRGYFLAAGGVVGPGAAACPGWSWLVVCASVCRYWRLSPLVTGLAPTTPMHPRPTPSRPPLPPTRAQVSFWNDTTAACVDRLQNRRPPRGRIALRNSAVRLAYCAPRTMGLSEPDFP